MASKINPKGIFKSNSRSKGPNPKGINPGGINNKPAPKPVPKPAAKPIVSSTKLKTTDPKSMGQVVKGQGYKAPTRTNTPAPKPAAKKPVKPVASKPVASTTTPRTRGGVSRGNTPGVGSKRKALADIKARANERLATEKAPKANLKRTPRVTAVQRSGKPAPGPKAGQRIVKAEAAAKALKSAKLAKAGKIGLIAGTVAAVGYGAKKLYDYATGSDNKPKKNTKKSERTDTLIETPSLKDELKKRGVDFKPAKDQAKTNWLDTAKKGDTLKYGINKPKADVKKEDSKKGAIPKAIDKAVRAADGNQPGSGESLKFTGDRSKVAGKDKWGRSPSSDWYGFNPETKKREAPTMVKGDTKKAETKPVVKTPPVKKPATTTPKAATPAVKKAEPVGTLAPKSTTEIASKTLEEAKTVTPSKTTTPAASTTSTTTSPSTASTPSIKTQPRATIGNRLRGALNESRERRAGRAETRGNENKAERLRSKIEETTEKMKMKKGGIVKSKTKKK